MFKFKSAASLKSQPLQSSLRFAVFLVLASCTTAELQTSSTPAQLGAVNEYFSYNEDQAFLDCTSPEGRAPANASMCEEIFEKRRLVKTDESGLLRSVSKNQDLMADVAQPTRADIDQTVALTPAMKDFRSKYLKFFTPSYTGREALVRSFEASLRMRSQFIEEKIRANGAKNEYDLVIIGSGVHGIIALHEALKEKPNAKILLVDEGDTGGATFRYGKDFFNINSSNRASGDGNLPLPGQGNLNELPGLPIQVSDMTAVKYPSANDLGSALVAGLYAAVKEHPNVDVLFNTAAQNPEPAERNELNLGLRLQGGREANVALQTLIVTTGLGTPEIPSQLKDFIEKNPSLQTKRTATTLPRVVTFEDLVRIVSQSNNPRQFFANKRFAVVGNGDSANVVLEYALGLATKDAYANSNAQEGRPEKILWLGQTVASCKQFIDSARSRYIQIAKGFETSDPNFTALISANPARLNTVSIRDDGKLDAVLNNGQRNEADDLDFVILTSGASKNVRGFFGESRAVSDDLFFANAMTPITSATRVSRGQRTKVGLKLKGAPIYVMGTAAGNLTTKEELVGVIQNSVSIFNNAPRVVAATQLAMNDLQPRARPEPMHLLNLQREDRNESLRITNIDDARLMPSQTVAFLKSVFQESLLYFKSPKERFLVEISLDPSGDLIVDTFPGTNLRPLIQLLAQTREFFSLTREILKLQPGQAIQLEASASATGRFNADQATLTLKRATRTSPPQMIAAVIPNNAMKLRGLVETAAPTDGDGDGGGGKYKALKLTSDNRPDLEIRGFSKPSLKALESPRPLESAVTAPYKLIPPASASEIELGTPKGTVALKFTPDGLQITREKSSKLIPNNLENVKLESYRLVDDESVLEVRLKDGRLFRSISKLDFSVFRRVEDAPLPNAYPSEFTSIRLGGVVRFSTETPFRVITIQRDAFTMRKRIDTIRAQRLPSLDIIGYRLNAAGTELQLQFIDGSLYQSDTSSDFLKFEKVPDQGSRNATAQVDGSAFPTPEVIPARGDSPTAAITGSFGKGLLQILPSGVLVYPDSGKPAVLGTDLPKPSTLASYGFSPDNERFRIRTADDVIYETSVDSDYLKFKIVTDELKAEPEQQKARTRKTRVREDKASTTASADYKDPGITLKLIRRNGDEFKIPGSRTVFVAPTGVTLVTGGRAQRIYEAAPNEIINSAALTQDTRRLYFRVTNRDSNKTFLYELTSEGDFQKAALVSK